MVEVRRALDARQQPTRGAYSASWHDGPTPPARGDFTMIGAAISAAITRRR
jgi:hypothetical protein